MTNQYFHVPVSLLPTTLTFCVVSTSLWNGWRMCNALSAKESLKSVYLCCLVHVVSDVVEDLVLHPDLASDSLSYPLLPCYHLEKE